MHVKDWCHVACIFCRTLRPSGRTADDSPAGSAAVPADEASVHDAVAEAVRIVRESGLPNHTDSMFTTIEGEWDEVFDVVKRATEAVGRYGSRVSLVIKADIRPGLHGRTHRKAGPAGTGPRRLASCTPGRGQDSGPSGAYRRDGPAGRLRGMFEHQPTARWIAVEDFLSEAVVRPDSSLKRAVTTALEAGMPPIEVAPNAGKLLKLLVQLSGARRVLEIGTLAGFSTIWMAQGLPDGGRLLTCEYLPKHAEVARANVDSAGLGHLVEIRVGAALDTLQALADEGAEPFDFVFIDADKENNPHYLDWAIRLGRPGTAIVMDNVVWEGAVLEPVHGPGQRPGHHQCPENAGRGPAAGRHRHPDRGLQRLGRLRPRRGCCSRGGCRAGQESAHRDMRKC